MILISLMIIAVVLLALGYFLLKTPSPFSLLINDTKENASFLKTFGMLYCLLGGLAGIIGIINTKFYAMLFLIFLLIFSAVFGVLFSQRITSKSK